MLHIYERKVHVQEKIRLEVGQIKDEDMVQDGV